VGAERKDGGENGKHSVFPHPVLSGKLQMQDTNCAQRL